MNALSLHISNMNNLKNKILKVAKGIQEQNHNILQDRYIKELKAEEIKSFLELYNHILMDDAHFEITNISNNIIKVIVFIAKQNYDRYNGDASASLERKVIRLKNVFPGF